MVVFLQMLCEERGFFLEIADFVKGLGLTILKGVMEARKSKVWARFVVEVCVFNNSCPHFFGLAPVGSRRSFCKNVVRVNNSEEALKTFSVKACPSVSFYSRGKTSNQVAEAFPVTEKVLRILVCRTSGCGPFTEGEALTFNS